MISALSEIIFKTCCRHTNNHTHITNYTFRKQDLAFHPLVQLYLYYHFLPLSTCPLSNNIPMSNGNFRARDCNILDFLLLTHFLCVCLKQSFSRALVFSAISPSNSTFPPFIQYMVFNITILILICWASRKLCIVLSVLYHPLSYLRLIFPMLLFTADLHQKTEILA